MCCHQHLAGTLIPAFWHSGILPMQALGAIQTPAVFSGAGSEQTACPMPLEWCRLIYMKKESRR